jgi:malate dehydrogenase
MQEKLKGVTMELDDCSYPLLNSVTATDSESTAFTEADFVFLVGSRPRGPGMERADLLRANGEIFTRVGQVLGDVAKASTKVIVVGNPANTNCLICMTHAKGIPQENFTAMTRLDHNRALAQMAIRAGASVTDV